MVVYVVLYDIDMGDGCCDTYLENLYINKKEADHAISILMENEKVIGAWYELRTIL